MNYKQTIVAAKGNFRLYDVDVVALVSYDQVTHRDDNRLALGYLTIVGAYVLPATSHETVTLVDLAVVDPETRSLVLRAGGTDMRQGRAALMKFEAEVREGTANVRVVSRNGQGGGGAFGIFELLFLLTAAAFSYRRTRSRLLPCRAPSRAKFRRQLRQHPDLADR